MKQLIAGNWKMNGLAAQLAEIEAVAAAASRFAGRADILICPPATLIDRAASLAHGQPLSIGAQDCHSSMSGAHTGDISARMIADLGATHVIVGHSERRADHNETDADIAAKARAASAAGLTPIICVGETAEERSEGLTAKVIVDQLRHSLPREIAGRPFEVAYEPVWAIGSGESATPEQIEEAHGLLLATLAQLTGGEGHPARVLYGGSLKPENADEILAIPGVGGGLIGGASLKADSFLAICDRSRQIG